MAGSPGDAAGDVSSSSGLSIEEVAALLVARGVVSLPQALDLTVRQVESLHEAMARSDADQRAAFIEDLATGIGCITSDGAKALETVVTALRTRAVGAPPASYTSQQHSRAEVLEL